MSEALALTTLVTATIPALVCACVGMRHLSSPRALSQALRQPPRLGQSLTQAAALRVARAWGAVEVVTGVSVCLLVFLPFPYYAQLVGLIWLSTVYAGLSTWLVVLWRRFPGATCGCGGNAEPADGPAFVRASVLGSCAAISTLVLLAGPQPDTPQLRWLLLPLAAVTAFIIWNVPSSIRMARAV